MPNLLDKIGASLSKAADDVKADPVGAVGGALAAGTAGAGLAVVAPTVVQGAVLAYGVAKVTDALGVTNGASVQMETAARELVEHPAEVGRVVIGVETAIATAAGAGAGAKALGAAFGGSDDVVSHPGNVAPPGNPENITLHHGITVPRPDTRPQLATPNKIIGKVPAQKPGLWHRFLDKLESLLGI